MQDSGGRAWREEQGAPWAFPVWAGTRKAAFKGAEKGQGDTITKAREERQEGRANAL